jgi:hypothetical protein
MLSEGWTYRGVRMMRHKSVEALRNDPRLMIHPFQLLDTVSFRVCINGERINEYSGFRGSMICASKIFEPTAQDRNELEIDETWNTYTECIEEII